MAKFDVMQYLKERKFEEAKLAKELQSCKRNEENRVIDEIHRLEDEEDFADMCARMCGGIC